MQILMVYPPNQLMPVETPRPDGSLGPLYLIGALRQIGLDADLIDMSVGSSEDKLEDTFYRNEQLPNGLIRIGMSQERIAEVVEGYDLICISSNFTPQTNMVFEVARIAKRVNPEVRIITGGINARNMPQRFLETGCFDLICNTEGELVIQEIAERLTGRKSLDGIPGTITRDSKLYPPGKTITDLDQLPFPAWDKLPFEKYDSISSPHGVDLTGRKERYAPIMTSRGCPFRCSFCHISIEKQDQMGIGNLRLKSMSRVLREIEMLKSLGVTKLYVEDDSLLAKKARTREIFTAIRGQGLTIADVNGVNLVHFFQRTGSGLEPDREYMQLLYDAGFRQIVFPVESGSQRILDKYASGKLNLEKMDVENLVRVAVDIGIACPINMMIGFPDETEGEIAKSIMYAQKLIDAGAPYVTFFIPIPFPGSVLYDIAIKGNHLDPAFNPDIMNWKNRVMINTAVPRERIVELRDRASKIVNSNDFIEQRMKQSMASRIAK